MQRLSAILLLAIFCVVAPGCGRRELPAGSDRRAFDAEQWKIDRAFHPPQNGGLTVRQEMLVDLVTRVLPGKSRSEIESLLGPSLVTPHFSRMTHDLIYFLGPESDSYIQMDSDWLLIWLGPQERFQRYQLVSD
jgi:hypothetical protein